jgi:hypothetical protein
MPLEDQAVEAGKAEMPAVQAAYIHAWLIQIPVDLKKHDLVPGGDQPIDERPPVGA